MKRTEHLEDIQEQRKKWRRLSSAALENSVGAAAALASLYATGGRDPWISGVTATAASFGFRQAVRCIRGLHTTALIPWASQMPGQRKMKAHQHQKLSDTKSTEVHQQQTPSDMSSSSRFTPPPTTVQDPLLEKNTKTMQGTAFEEKRPSPEECNREVETSAVKSGDDVGHAASSEAGIMVSATLAATLPVQVVDRETQQQQQRREQHQQQKMQLAAALQEHVAQRGKHHRQQRTIRENVRITKTPNTGKGRKANENKPPSNRQKHDALTKPKAKRSLALRDEADQPDGETVVDSESDQPDDEAVLEILSSDDESLHSGIAHDGYTQVSPQQSPPSQHHNSNFPSPLRLC